MGEMTQDNIRFSSLFKIEGALKDLIWAECKLVIETYGAEDGLGPLNLQDFFQPPSVHIAIVKSDSDRGTIAKVEADHTNSYPWDTSYATDHSSDMRNSYGWGTAPVLMNELHIDTTNVQLFKARELFTVMAAEQTCAMQQVHSSSGEKFFFKPRMDLMAPEFDREASVLGTMISLDLHKTLRVSPFIGFVLLDNGLVTGMLFDWLEGSPLAETPQLGDQQLHKIWHDQVQATVDELHRHNIIWGDVNVRNIFIDTNDDAWVIDFGGNCNVQFVDEELKETYDGDRQGLRRISKTGCHLKLEHRKRHSRFELSLCPIRTTAPKSPPGIQFTITSKMG